MLSYCLLLGWEKQLLLKGTTQYRNIPTLLSLTALWLQEQPRSSDCSLLLSLFSRSIQALWFL